jgi:hypothetical protein
MGDWITVSQAAKLAGVPVRTMRRHLHALDERFGHRILRRYGPRKLWVHSGALQHALRSDPDLMSEQLTGLTSRLGEVERRVTALRGAHRNLSDRVELNQKSTAAWQEACAATLTGLERMARISYTAKRGQ